MRMIGMADLANAAKHAERLAASFAAVVETVARIEQVQEDMRRQIAEIAALQRRMLDMERMR